MHELIPNTKTKPTKCSWSQYAPYILLLHFISYREYFVWAMAHNFLRKKNNKFKEFSYSNYAPSFGFLCVFVCTKPSIASSYSQRIHWFIFDEWNNGVSFSWRQTISIHIFIFLRTNSVLPYFYVVVFFLEFESNWIQIFKKKNSMNTHAADVKMPAMLVFLFK